MSDAATARSPTERRLAYRREGDRSHLSDADWRQAVERDLQSDARATRGMAKALKNQNERLKKVEEGVSGLTDKVDAVSVAMGEHTPVSVEDGAYLAILRVQYPIPLMAKLAALIAGLEAQQAAAGRHWSMVQHLFQYVIGGLISVCVLVIGMGLQTQHIITVPQLLILAFVVLVGGFLGYAFVSGKAASFAKGNIP